MTPKQFDKIASDLIGGVLAPAGFSKEKSRFCTFYRKVSEEIYHVILPDLGTRAAWYDVKVFPASPLLDPMFDAQFPDDLGLPTDSWSYLSERGVGLEQQTFNCKSEDNLRRRFEMTVKPLLLQKAIPYLDQISTIEDMIPLIKNPLFLGFALHHIGQTEAARRILREQSERLSRLNSSDKNVVIRLQRVYDLLHI
jgi:hypothetical protein